MPPPPGDRARADQEEDRNEHHRRVEDHARLRPRQGHLTELLTFYLDLWHGTCRRVEYKPPAESYPAPTFTLTASYKDITSILTGKLNPMTAMMTSKLKVKGSMGYMMRNVPTVLDFVRVAQEVTTEIL